MKPSVSIKITDDHGSKFFGEGPCRLLREIERTGSLRAAAMSMEMAYSKASRLLKQAETSLGFPLTTRTTGGKDGGGSVLTPQANRWLKQYESYRDACITSNMKLFRELFPRFGCVIMASGLGKRFGSNKLMADFGGEPMLCKTLAATEGLFDVRVVVTRHEEVAQLCRQKNVSVVLHDFPHRSDTIRLGLEAIGDVESCLFCPGDQPLLRHKTIAALLDHWCSNRDCICRPVSNGIQGSPVLFPEWTFPELKNLADGNGGTALLKRCPEKISLMEVADPYELMDADTPEALAQLYCHAFAIEKEESYDPKD